MGVFNDQTLFDYLSRLSSDYLELIFQYAKELPDPLLLSLFTLANSSSSDRKELKPRESIQDLLIAHDRVAVLKAYLEHIINEQRDTSTKSHTMLAKIYLDLMRQEPEGNERSCAAFWSSHLSL